MVVSWLVYFVSITIRQSIVWMDITLDIWNDLKSRYSQGDLSRIFNLQLGVASLNQGELSLTDYFTKLRIIWDELENFRPNLLCICHKKCSCSVAFTFVINQRKFEDQAIQFLRGLNEQYHNIRSRVLLMEPISPITKKNSLVVQQERQLASKFSVSNINSANSNRISTFVIYAPFVVQVGIQRTFVFGRLNFLIKKISLSKIMGIRNYVPTVEEMVTP